MVLYTELYSVSKVYYRNEGRLVNMNFLEFVYQSFLNKIQNFHQMRSRDPRQKYLEISNFTLKYPPPSETVSQSRFVIASDRGERGNLFIFSIL